MTAHVNLSTSADPSNSVLVQSTPCQQHEGKISSSCSHPAAPFTGWRQELQALTPAHLWSSLGSPPPATPRTLQLEGLPLLHPQQEHLPLTLCPQRSPRSALCLQNCILSSMEQLNFFQPESLGDCLISCSPKAGFRRSRAHDLIGNFNENTTFCWS